MDKNTRNVSYDEQPTRETVTQTRRDVLETGHAVNFQNRSSDRATCDLYQSTTGISLRAESSSGGHCYVKLSDPKESIRQEAEKIFTKTYK